MEKPWEELYPELVNKFRWAISTSCGTAESRYPFGDSQRMATVFAQQVLDLVKAAPDAPGLLSSTDSIRSFNYQRAIDRVVEYR